MDGSLGDVSAGLATATPVPLGTGRELSTIDIVLQAEPVLQFTLLVLIVFSIVSWGIIFYKFRYLRHAARETSEFLEAFWRSDNLDEAYRSVSNYPHAPVAQVFRAGFAELRRLLAVDSDDRSPKKERKGEATANMGPSSLDNVIRALRRAGTAQVTVLERRLSFLATCGSTSPFIGLFGTVWGILRAFQRIGAAGSASIATVGPAISEALIATAVGLFAAIPAVIAYNYFLSRVRILTAEMDNFSSDFLNIVKRHFVKD